MTIIYDRESSKLKFEMFTRDELRETIQEITGKTSLQTCGEMGIKAQDVIYAAKGTLEMDSYLVIGFAIPQLWQTVNPKHKRSDFGRHKDENQSVVVEKLTVETGNSKSYAVLPSQTIADLKRLNKGFRALPNKRS